MEEDRRRNGEVEAGRDRKWYDKMNEKEIEKE
jgi:hypothetical protein